MKLKKIKSNQTILPKNTHQIQIQKKRKKRKKKREKEKTTP